MNDINAISRYPLNIGNGGPDAADSIAIPIPVSALDHQLTFTGTPLGIAYSTLVYFLLQMCFDRFSRKRKPKAPKKNANGTANVSLVAANPEHAGEAEDESEQSEMEESELEEHDEEAEHARDMALPTGNENPVHANPSSAELESLDTGDEAYEILMNHNGQKCRKVRMFLETVVRGRGVIVGYVLWFYFYEPHLFGRMFLSMLGYNQAFAAKNAPALQKMRSKPNDYDIATRKSIEINSVTSYKECIHRIMAGHMTLPEEHLTNPDLIKSNCPYNLINLFGYANIERFFAGSWNFTSDNITSEMNIPSHPKYPWMIMEVPDSLVERPYDFSDLPIDTLLREEVIRILRPTSGVISPAQRDEINTFVASMPNLMQQRINEKINELLEKRDYIYKTGNVVKDMREHGATEEDIHQFFKDRYTTIHHELFRNPAAGNINCSEVEYVALRDAPSVTLPRASEPVLFPHRSSLPLRGDMLRQFLETLVKHCFMHKGDRLNQAMSDYLASLPCDSAYTMDEIVLGIFGEKETGKSTAHILREHMTCDKRVKRMDAVTPKTLEVNDNWNNHIMLFDEVQETVLGIQPNNPGKNNPATGGNSLVNAQKQLYTGGYHTGTYFNSDSSDRSNRMNGTYMLCGSGSWIFSQNLRMNIVHMSPLISRFCLFFNQYFSRFFIDPDSTSNNDNGLTRDMEACVGPYGLRFFRFMKKIDQIMLIYCIYVKMGAFHMIDMTFARCVMNAMNDAFAAKHMRKYSNRLGDRLRTMIRRTDIWLSILAFFASGLSLQLLPGKTHLDFESLVVLNKYIQANGCSTQAITYVLTLFSTEIIVDTSHIVQEALKEMFNDVPQKFTAADNEPEYVKPPFRSKADMANWLTETTGINAMDSLNALFALTKLTPKDSTGIEFYRPFCYAESHMSAYLIHRHFLTGEGPNVREDFTTILQQSMCIERTTPQVVLTSFHHHHTIGLKKTVILGAIHRCLSLEPVRGRYLILRKHNPNEEDVDHPTLIEYITNDFITPRDATMWNISPCPDPSSLLQYPEEAAERYYTQFMERKRETAFLTEASACIPSYCVTADVMLLDPANAVTELKQRIDHLFPGIEPIEKMMELFVVQTAWYRMIHRQWKLNLFYRKWLELAIKRPANAKEDVSADIVEVELEIEDTMNSDDMQYEKVVTLFNTLKQLRSLFSSHPSFYSVFGTLAEHVADAIPIPPWYYLMQCEMQFRCHRSSFLSATFIATLRHVGTTEEKAMIIQMENVVKKVLERECTTYKALPTSEDIAQYPVERSSIEHLFAPATIAFWSKHRGENHGAVLQQFQQARSAWCKVRHAHGMLLEYKMVAILYAFTKNTLYADLAYDRVDLIRQQLASISMEDVFENMMNAYAACRADFGSSVFDNMLKEDSVPGILPGKTMQEVLTDELRTTLFESYATLFDMYFQNRADMFNVTIQETMLNEPFLKDNEHRFMDIPMNAVRSFAMIDRAESRKRPLPETQRAITSQHGLYKQRMLVFQKK